MNEPAAMPDAAHERADLIRLPYPASGDPAALLPSLAEWFGAERERKTATVALTYSAADADTSATVDSRLAAFATRAVRDGVADRVTRDGDTLRLCVSRATFWQHPSPWLTAPSSGGAALRYVVEGGRRHPARPPKPTGVVYRRYLPALGSAFTLRSVDVDEDTERFHRWMNADRVARFWDLRGTREEHAAYLAAQCADAHVHPLIGAFDDRPFAYFEAYWAKEDRIAPFYDAHDFDRGLHLLVGERDAHGPGKLYAWFNSVLHYLFLDDPRTQRIVGEPRIDNDRHIAYMHRLGGYTLKEFDFPHKRAALVVLERDTFFTHHGP
jgi:RimJ/RimL family protein N-acetyltransferase